LLLSVRDLLVSMTISNDLQDSLESRIARRLSSAMTTSQRMIADELSNADMDTIAVQGLPLDTWDAIAAELQKAIRPELERAYMESANEFSDSLMYGLNEAALSSAAQGWAASYSYDLVTSINETSHTRLTSVLTQFTEGSMTNRELMQELSGIFGSRRSQTIAITEITRAAAEGQAYVARELGLQGVSMIPIWETRRDERVCPTCGPRDNMVQGSNWFMLPPAHPNCRCGVRYQYNAQ
jgi:hypothetical protein